MSVRETQRTRKGGDTGGIGDTRNAGDTGDTGDTGGVAVTSADGGVVHRHRWNPVPGTSPERARGVYLFHGMSEHAARYERLATRLTGLGWCVGAHDHPGHGRSDGRRGVLEEPDELVDRGAVELAAFSAETGAAPYLFAHSLGAVVATELVLGRRVPVAGLVLSAPAITPRLTPTDRLKLAVLSAVAPSYALEMSYDASRLTSDPDEIAAAHADRLIHHSKSASIVNWLVEAAGRAIDRADQLDVPTLVLLAGSDLLIDTARTREFVRRAPPGLVELCVYDEYRHELLNETPVRRDRVMDDIERWLDARDAEAGHGG